jgi:hypothetical protein
MTEQEQEQSKLENKIEQEQEQEQQNTIQLSQTKKITQANNQQQPTRELIGPSRDQRNPIGSTQIKKQDYQEQEYPTGQWQQIQRTRTIEDNKPDQEKGQLRTRQQDKYRHTKTNLTTLTIQATLTDPQ